MKKTIVLGASLKPERYSNMAVKSLRAHGHEVVAIGSREGRVGDVDILKGKPPVADVDTITLYLNPFRQEEFYDYILDLKPRRIIFNPGTENLVFMNRVKLEGVEVLPACTLVMLNTGQY